MDKETVKELKKIFWAYVGKHGVVVNNGNIDYVVEQAIKEWGNEKN